MEFAGFFLFLFSNGSFVSTFSLFSLSLLLELKKVADPYRWLEDPDAPETVEFVKQQNEVFFGLLSGSESREKVLFSPFSLLFCSTLGLFFLHDPGPSLFGNPGRFGRTCLVLGIQRTKKGSRISSFSVTCLTLLPI